MSFMFKNDQWDDNYDQYKVDLEVENERLRKENKELKKRIKALEKQLYPQENPMEKIRWVRNTYGYGLNEVKKAFELFDCDVDKAVHYLQLRGDAVCRKKPNGKKWTEQDYIDYVNSFDF